MMVAFGKTRWMRPTKMKFLGSLSVMCLALGGETLDRGKVTRAEASLPAVAEPPGIASVPSTTCVKYISSPAPNTSGWLARICSIKIMLERGIPAPGSVDAVVSFSG
jgi:hypothetical protein